MFGQAIYLCGDGFPGDVHVEAALRERLASRFSEWIGQEETMARTGEKEFRRGVTDRLNLLERLVVEKPFLIGRSSGARIASVFATRRTVAGVICIGYPFRAPGRVLEPDRFAHLAQIAVPTLILQGARDSYGGADLTENYALSPSVTVRLIDGDHDMRLSPAAWDAIRETILAFCDRALRYLPFEPQPFDEAFYLQANPDVAAQVSSGRFASGHEHFSRLGRQQGRGFRLLPEVAT